MRWLLAAGGCGVPGTSLPIDRGAAPPADVQERPVPYEPEGPDRATSAQEVIQGYFQAAAWSNSKGGNRPNAIEDAERRVRGFLTAEGASAWSAGNRELTLVRVSLGEASGAGDGAVAVEATLEPVGVLDDVGSVRAPSTTDLMHYTFTIVPTDSGRHRRLLGVPNGLFLDVSFLMRWYDVRTIYFWAADSSTVLVPDRRYMPTAVSSDKQPNEVWRWLTKGPSELVAPAVAALPDNVKLKGNVVTEHQRGDPVLVVDLTSEAAGMQLQSLVTQLRWSMRPVELPVELRIEGVRKDIDGASSQYLRFNPAVRSDGQSEPEKLFVLGGKVRFVNETGSTTLAILESQENRDVITAALVKDSVQQRIAFVRKDPDGRQRLWVGQLAGQGEARAPSYVRSEVVGTSLSRPVWLTGEIPRVLLAVDGRLVAVTTGGQATTVEASPGVPSHISAVAAAPDGRRLAIVGDGLAGIAPLRIDGDALNLRAFFPLATTLKEPRGIGWSREDHVLVGGQAASGSPLIELSVDGTRREPVERADLSSLVITRLVAYPDDPSQNGDRVLAMFEANGQAYNVYGQQVAPLVPSDRSPAASAPTDPLVPTAPLFYESI
ncbi:MAG: hypothetical protein HKP61_04075 [Dactylosporangium sp.]|nr:hypothetical protein [Dactylosporangium sp.]NNJ60129.1 hypothetical protein [Dactylosporangium sp.]